MICITIIAVDECIDVWYNITNIYHIICITYNNYNIIYLHIYVWIYMYIVLLSLLLLLLLILLYNNLCHYKWFPSEKGACGKPSKAACTGLLDKLRELELGGARTERNGGVGGVHPRKNGGKMVGFP